MRKNLLILGFRLIREISAAFMVKLQAQVSALLDLKERSMVFWAGVILFCLAFTALFQIVWMVTVVMYPANRAEFTKGLVPLIVGSIIFMVVGIAMIKSGRKES